MRKTKPNPKANRGVMGFTYIVVGLFIVLAIYMVYYIQVKAEDDINNPYNSRISEFEDRTIRGKILSADGEILAETVIESDGNAVRRYPYGSMYAHVVGYSTVGKTGIESIANFYLINSHANLIEQAVNELTDQKNMGDTVVTTLDSELQKIAYDALGDRRGAVVAMEPDTGKILAMVSKPAFDPNTVADDWTTLISGDASEARLLNRATQGLYPPGSTFKIVTALEYMRENQGSWEDYTFDCDGIYEYDDYTIQCYHQTSHGYEDFALAFANSCNGAFANLGLSLDLSKLYDLAEDLLFNKDLPISLAYSSSIYSMMEDAGDWEILQTSIGQGGTLITPMHNLMITSAIANGGTLMEPYVIDHVENAGGSSVKKFKPKTYGNLMKSSEAEALTELMTGVVNEGTGSALRTDSYQAAGKTGSAEFETGKETHAWFVGFAPADDPKIAVCVIVEEGGSGGTAAAPIARQMFDAYLAR